MASAILKQIVVRPELRAVRFAAVASHGSPGSADSVPEWPLMYQPNLQLEDLIAYAAGELDGGTAQCIGLYLVTHTEDARLVRRFRMLRALIRGLTGTKPSYQAVQRARRLFRQYGPQAAPARYGGWTAVDGPAEYGKRSGIGGRKMYF